MAEGSMKVVAKEPLWRIALLLVTLVVLGGVFALYGKGSPFVGKVQPEAHEKTKRKAEVDKRFKEGVVMLHAKRYDDAATAFHRVLALSPEMPEAHVNMGFALLGLGQAAAARDFFDGATILRPNQLNAYFGLAEALEKLGDDFGAMQAMETYVHLAPKDDPFRRKAESAAWELRERLATQRQAAEAKEKKP